MKRNYFILNSIVVMILCISCLHAQNWKLAGSVPKPGPQPSIVVVNGDNVWIAGGPIDTPKVYQTSNGGINWNDLPTTGITKELNCVWAINPSSAFVGEGSLNEYAKLYKTTDYGANWSVVMQTGNNQGYFNGIVFARNDFAIGYGMALAERIYKTTNNGDTWVMLMSGVNGVSNAHNSLMMVDNDFYGFGMNNGAARIRLTTDNASSWTNQVIGVTGNYTSAIAFKNDKQLGVAATSTSMPYIARTTNGGLVWTSINIDTGVTGKVVMKWITSMPVVYILGANGAIKQSADNGLTWHRMYTPPGVQNLYHFDFVKIGNLIYGYAISTDGTVIKLCDSILIVITGNKNKDVDAPSDYELGQNYPNPFNPNTNIEFKIPKEGMVTLKVYDILGHELTVLMDEKLHPGKFNVRWDADNFPSGVYYYKLQAGDFSETKKMILLK
jgi:photosystem II stability/assembly factor-like uncharacterized protein